MPTSPFTTTMLKLKTSKERIQKFQKQLATECEHYEGLLALLQTDLSNQIGQNVVITAPNGVKPKTRIQEVIVKRIQELRLKNYSFEEIATRLATAGYKQETGLPFTGTTVRNLYDEEAA